MDKPTPPPIVPVPQVPASDGQSERQFYFHKNEQQTGPYTEQQVEEMLLAGSITGTDLAWHEGLPNWQSLSTIIPTGKVDATSLPPSNNAWVQNVLLSVFLLLVLVVGMLYFSLARKTDSPKSTLPAPTPSLLTRSGHSTPSATSTAPAIADDPIPQATPQITVLPALPLNSPPPLPVPSPAPPLYSVVGISAGDTLNVHSAPASTSPVTAQLPNAYDKITVVGDAVMNGTTAWVNITFAEGSGWVNRDFLNQQTPVAAAASVSPDPTTAAPVALPVTAASATPATLPLSSPTQPTYAVLGLRAGDTLNVHSAPASTSPVTVRLPNGYGKIAIVGDAVMNNTTTWVNITFAEGSGWVNKDFLSAETP